MQPQSPRNQLHKLRDPCGLDFGLSFSDRKETWCTYISQLTSPQQALLPRGPCVWIWLFPWASGFFYPFRALTYMWLFMVLPSPVVCLCLLSTQSQHSGFAPGWTLSILCLCSPSVSVATGCPHPREEGCRRSQPAGQREESFLG